MCYHCLLLVRQLWNDLMFSLNVVQLVFIQGVGIFWVFFVVCFLFLFFCCLFWFVVFFFIVFVFLFFCFCFLFFVFCFCFFVFFFFLFCFLIIKKKKLKKTNKQRFWTYFCSYEMERQQPNHNNCIDTHAITFHPIIIIS